MATVNPGGCPVFQYTSVKAFDDGNMQNSTSSEKLERDFRSLIDAGYRSVSLNDCFEIVQSRKQAGNTDGEKCCSVVFLSGYLDNYTNVFPLLKKYNIKASIFVATGLMGLNSFPGIDNFIPHFGWSQAQEMVESGLANIFPLWHPFDNKADFFDEIKRKKRIIENNCKGNGSFSIIAKCDVRDYDKVKAAGYDALLFDALEMDACIIINNGVPAINVEHSEAVIDSAHKFMYLCELAAQKDPNSFGVVSGVQSVEANCTKKLQLPLQTDPMIKNYLRHAVPLGIIEAFDKHRAERLVLNDYINISYKPAYNELDYNNDLYEYWDCLNCQRTTNDILKYNDLMVNDYIIRGLRAGYYADMWLDAYYIPGKYDYQKNHKTHGLFVYGYDLDLKCYYCTTYTERLLYEKLVVPMDAVKDAVSSYLATNIVLIKNAPNASIKYNIRLLFKRLKDYLKSVVYDDPSTYHKQTFGQYHQFSAVEAFAANVRKSGNIPTTALYCFAEHKRTMAWRIKYICEQESIYDAELIDVADKMIKDAEWLVTASVKYIISHSAKMFDQICGRMEALNTDDRRIVSTILAHLKEKYAWIDSEE